MRDEHAISLLIEMLRIYTPSLQEAPLAEYIATRMRNDLGFNKVRIDDANNVIGEIGSGSPTILLSGHMDTVPGQQPAKIIKKTIHGRGACDAKASLAAMLIAASDLAVISNMGRIVVAAVSDEEGNGLGTRTLINGGITADYAIFGEPSGVDNVTIGYKGRLGFTLTCEAPQLHASVPWVAENAIESIYDVWGAIKSFAAANTGSNRYSSVTASLTGIHGGSSHNTTPERCKATIDMRIPPQQSTAAIAKEVEKIICQFQSNTTFPNIKLKIDDVTEPFETDKASTLVRAIIRGILQVRKKRPLLLRKTGTGDMNLLGHQLKIPVITYGPGDSHLSHTRKEFIEIDEYLSSIEVYKAAVNNIIKMHNKS